MGMQFLAEDSRYHKLETSVHQEGKEEMAEMHHLVR